MQKTERKYNVDLLRIVAMLMIITLHVLSKGGLLAIFPVLSLKYNLVWFAEMISFIGVNCFVLISGYFLVKSQFKIRKLLLLEAEVLFYTVFIYAGLVIIGKVPFTIPDFLSSIMPTLTGEYWFVSAYMGLYILSPFLNIGIKGLSKRIHRNLAFTLIGIFSVWPIVFFFGDSFGLQGFNLNIGYSLTWFIVLYVIASYITLYYKPDYKLKNHFIRYILAAVLAPIILLGVVYLSNNLNMPILKNLIYLLTSYSSITVLLPSIFIFILFLNIRIKNNVVNKLIAFFAPLTFAVYLIHEEPHVRVLLWNKLLISEHIHNPYFIPFIIVTIGAIFVVCALADWFRVQLFNFIARKKWFINLMNYLTKRFNDISFKIQKKLDK